MDPDYYLCKRCGVNWEGAPGHPLDYCDSIFYPAEVKRLELQISELERARERLLSQKSAILKDAEARLNEKDRLNGELKRALRTVVDPLMKADEEKNPDAHMMCGCALCVAWNLYEEEPTEKLVEPVKSCSPDCDLCKAVLFGDAHGCSCHTR